jgi:folate-binding protein YgfZ
MPNDPAAPAPAGTWHSPREDVAACLREPVAARLDELGVIAVDGPDAVSFLHAQLTNDVAGLDAERVQLNGYCSAKGRLYAVFDNWRDAGSVYLQLPREVLPEVMKRLSMFVLRAKAKLRDASGDWRAIAIVGPGAAQALAPVGELPDVGRARVLADGSRLMRLPPAPQVAQRFLLLARAASTDSAHAAIAALKQVPSGVYWWTQIDAAIPNVFAATQQKFVPQMINLEVLGGVNFRKGCYPGQEVVARSQYLGKLRRRMQIAHTDGVARAGADVFVDGVAEPIGTIVMAATAPQGGMDLLFECPVERAVGALHLDSSSGPPLAPRPLPYALVDVTA